MTLYDILIDLSKDGYNRIYIDLPNKSLQIGREIVIDHGNVVGDVAHNHVFVGLIDDRLDIDELYEQYKYSVPSERDCKRSYFKALPSSELTDGDLVYGMPRLEARIRLESYILLASLSGLLTWEDQTHWYRLGKDHDFVLLKKHVI